MGLVVVVAGTHLIWPQRPRRLLLAVLEFNNNNTSSSLNLEGICLCCRYVVFASPQIPEQIVTMDFALPFGTRRTSWGQFISRKMCWNSSDLSACAVFLDVGYLLRSNFSNNIHNNSSTITSLCEDNFSTTKYLYTMCYVLLPIIPTYLKTFGIHRSILDRESETGTCQNYNIG